MCHLIPEEFGGTNDIDNAIALCTECRKEVGWYNPRHPRGDFRAEELKPRREQVYEEFTRHLAPPLNYHITQTLSDRTELIFPEAAFVIRHQSDILPVRIRTAIAAVLPSGMKIPFEGIFSGDREWNLNPRFEFSDRFTVPSEAVESSDEIRLEVKVVITDMHDWPHTRLPVHFTRNAEKNTWKMAAC